MAWSLYQNTNNRYQSANVTVGLSCQRDADMSVTDTATQVCYTIARRQRTVKSGHDTMWIHERPLSNRERDGEPIVPA